MGRLGGTVVERLPSAQGMIPAFWDEAHIRLLRWESASSSPLPLLVFPLSLAVSLCQINKILKKN